MFKLKILLTAVALPCMAMGSEFTGKDFASSSSGCSSSAQVYSRSDYENELFNKYNNTELARLNICASKVASDERYEHNGEFKYGTNGYSFQEKINGNLKCAAGNGHYDVASLLLQQASVLQATPEGKRDAAEAAALNGHLSTMELLINSIDNSEWKKSAATRSFTSAACSGNEEIVQYFLTHADNNFRPEVETVRSQLCIVSSSRSGSAYSPAMTAVLKQYLQQGEKLSQRELSEMQEYAHYNPFSSMNPAFLPGRPGFGIDQFIEDITTNAAPVVPVHVNGNFISAQNVEVVPVYAAAIEAPARLANITAPTLNVNEFLRFALTQNDCRYMDANGHLWLISNYEGLASELTGVSPNAWRNDTLHISETTFGNAYEGSLAVNSQGVQFHYRVKKHIDGVDKSVEFVLTPASDEVTAVWKEEQKTAGYSPRVKNH